jgi:O-antigen/teichoic acid export membrane protein
LSVAAILSTFSLTGLSSSITRSVARGFDGSLKQGFRENLRWSWIIYTGGLIGAIYYFINGNQTLAASMLLIGTLAPFTSSASLYVAFLEAKKDFRRQTLYSAIRSIAPVLALLATLALTDNPLLIILVYFLVNFASTGLLYYRTLKVFRPSNAVEDHSVSYGKHLSLMNVIGLISTNLDKVLVFQILGAAPLAIYSFAIAPIDQLQVSKKFLRILAIPKLSTKTIKEIQRSINHKALLILMVSVFITALYILFIPIFYKLLLPQYLDSIFYSRIYALMLLFIPITLYTESLIAQKKTRELYFIKTVPPIVRIVLYLTLLPAYGITGLIVGTLLARLFGSIMTIIVFHRSS